MKLVKNSLKKDIKEKPFVVLDNAASHRAGIAQDFLNRHFKPLFMVPYSSPSNSIERVWSLAKWEYQKTAQKTRHELSQASFAELVGSVLKSLSEDTLQNLINSNRADLIRYRNQEIMQQN